MAQNIERCRKEDPPTKKKLPVGIDVPIFLVELWMEKEATEMVMEVGDCAVIAFYYLLQVGVIYNKKPTKLKKEKVAVQVGRYNVFLLGC